jgi:glycosyltransferase involved in cell wall biosynthesis
VVVVDDGSTDDTATVAAQYVDRGVRYVYQENAGAAAARDRGVATANGPLVAFCDADDVWLPDKLAAQVAHLHAHPDVDLVTAHAYACDEALQPTSVVHAGSGASADVFEALLVRNIVLNPTCVLVRRDVLLAAGGFGDLSRWEDWDTWIRIAKRSRVGFLDRPVALVRRHRESLSPSDGRHRFELDGEVLERHIGDVDRAWRRALIRTRARSNASFHAGTTAAAGGDHRLARRFAWRALALDPFTLARRKLRLAARVTVPERWSARAVRRARVGAVP